MAEQKTPRHQRTSGTEEAQVVNPSSSPADVETKTDGQSAVREVSQSQPDRVAMVSRTSTGEPHQSPGYEVISVPEDADEATRAAAENRPEKG
jgi:hypothetical protein